ncbi:MAG: alpha-amylase family glycosyl hydrolase [Bacteroidetes bacterium]|nr:alpha-amylase family glycosyl hydrolase [Bacteroidota bacterium]
MTRNVSGFVVTIFLLSGPLFAQTADSVDVTFTYVPKGIPSAVYLPGEFNSWANNVNGIIPAGSSALMSKDQATGAWTKTVRLRVGGQATDGFTSGAYEYKFNENRTVWLSDPLNPLQDLKHENNSIIYTASPTIYHLLPNSVTGIVNSQRPKISAYIFPSLANGVDTSSFLIVIDSTVYQVPGTAYDMATKRLTFIPPAPLENGIRKVRLTVKNLSGNEVSDSAPFIVQAGTIQILNQGGHVTRKAGIILSGTVQDTSIHRVRIVQNGRDTTAIFAERGGFSFSATYTEGLNTFVALATDTAGDTLKSDPFTMTYYVNHSPNAVISFSSSGSSITMSGEYSSEPDSGQTGKLTYLWSVDPTNPSSVAGVQGATSQSLPIVKPSVSGEYYFSLVVSDPDGNKDTTRSYFTLDRNDSVYFPTYASNPEWVKMGRIYELFFNSFTSEKTINAAAQRLDYIKQLGFNIIWVMPVMKNNQAIDNGPGPGYNIVDFYTVAPQYGTNEDFRNFVEKAHEIGLKVILDVTPNHTSYNHPFVKDARLFGTYSFYWNFYQHQLIRNPLYSPMLSESITTDYFVYYGGFSDQLLNYNWGDVDARTYMDAVYKWWIEEMGVDGYRFDVYWGPHARTNGGNGGETDMGIPTRTVLKHIKPDVFLLGETSGTGVGTQVNYADSAGGLDAAYDWNLLHNSVQSFSFGSSGSVNTLNTYVTNSGGNKMGFVPGPNALFLRGMENHDEDRIAFIYNSYGRTMPMATVIFTVPGIPMLYSGQEVGFGRGITNLDERRRGVIDWNAGGKTLLTPHYQRLAWIRGSFPAFSTQTFFRLTTGNSWMYGYTRPYPDQNGIVLANFGGASVRANITLIGRGNSRNVYFTGGVTNGKTYYMNDVYNDTSYAVTFSNDSLNFSTVLPAYGSAIYALSDSIIRMSVPQMTGVEEKAPGGVPASYSLSQNYPNPFNPTTVIRYTLPERTFVRMDVYDILGQCVRTPVSSEQAPGIHEVIFDGQGLASGVYFYRLSTGNFVKVEKMLRLK